MQDDLLFEIEFNAEIALTIGRFRESVLESKKISKENLIAVV